MRCNDDKQLGVCSQLPQQREKQRVVEKVHGIAANNDIKLVLQSAVCDFFETQSFALFPGTGTVSEMQSQQNFAGEHEKENLGIGKDYASKVNGSMPCVSTDGNSELIMQVISPLPHARSNNEPCAHVSPCGRCHSSRLT